MNQSAASEDRRAKRQSRQTREFVSSQGQWCACMQCDAYRYNVAHADVSNAGVPTAEWHEQLLRRLSGGSASLRIATPSTPYSASSSEHARYPSYSSSSGATSPVLMSENMSAFPTQPNKRRRRVESPLASTLQSRQAVRQSREPTGLLLFSLLETAVGNDDVAESHPQGEEYDEAIDAFGHLSVDQNQEVRRPHGSVRWFCTHLAH